MIPSRSFVLAFILGAAAAPAYAQELTNVALPTVQNGKFVATASPWTKDDGKATFSGTAVAARDIRGNGHISLIPCGDAPDMPKSLTHSSGRPFAVGTYPAGAGGARDFLTILPTVQTQNAGWVRIDSVSAEVVVGSAKITWVDRYAADGKLRPVAIEARFRAQFRSANDRSLICPPRHAGTQTSAQSNPTPTPVQAPAPNASATKSNFQPTDGFKPTPVTPAYPFGLENLLKTIANDPPALQQAVRGAYSAMQGDNYYDAGCVAHAFREARKTDPNTSPMPGAVRAPGCVDRARIIKMYARFGNSPQGANIGAAWMTTLWPNASAEKRTLFANCFAERMADIIVVSIATGTRMPDVMPAEQFAEACKGALL